jgi:hypothetical protein
MATNADGTKLVQTTKISQRWRVSLVKAVREELSADGQDPEIGDRIVYRKKGDDIVVELA